MDVIIKHISSLNLTDSELNKLRKGQLRLLFCTSNACEVAVLLGKAEFKLVNQPSSGGEEAV